MITFCPVSGLPQTGFFPAHSPSFPRSEQGHDVPDLLESQQAYIHITCDCGVTSRHLVSCSMHITDQRSYPPLDRQEWVVCSSCGEENRLLRPQILHDSAKKRVVIRLPEAFRTRTYGVMSWWFATLANSTRQTIPPYASTPTFEFIQESGGKSASKKPNMPPPFARPSQSSSSLSSVSSPSLSAISSASSLTPPPSTPPMPSKPTPLSTPPMPKGKSKRGDAHQTTETLESSSLDDLPMPKNKVKRSKKTEPSPILSNVASDAGATAALNPFASSKSSPKTMPLELSNIPSPTNSDLPPLVPNAGSPSSSALTGLDLSSAKKKNTVSFDAPLDPLDMLSSPGDDEDPTKIGLTPKPGAGLPGMTQPLYRDELFARSTKEDLPASKEPLADVPTVAKPASDLLAELRSAESGGTSVRKRVGEGISTSREFEKAKPIPGKVADWKKTGQIYYFHSDPAKQVASVQLMISAGATRVLDQGGKIQFFLQLHRMPSYPLLVCNILLENTEGEIVHTFECPMDLESTDALLFLDLLMQKFRLEIHFCTKTYTIYRDLHIDLPLEQNVEYLLDEGRIWMESLAPSARNFRKALTQFQKPDYDRLGKMSHNFDKNSFSGIESPAKAKFAVGIMAYWSEQEQYDYLLTRKSFPIKYFRDIQKRVLNACIDFGIHMPDHLMRFAIDQGVSDSFEDIVRRTLSSFTEFNLHIRQPNDLDPWDNLDNWQKILDACDEYDIEVDQDIEKLIEAAERRVEEESAQPIEVDDDDDIEELDGFMDMDAADLIELLQDPSVALDAALALCELADPAHVDHVAAIFPQLDQEEAIIFSESFIKFGSEAETFLMSWLHLPNPYQREASMLALGTMGATKALDAIIKRLRSGEEWEVAAEAIGRIGNPATPSLARELKNKNWLIRLRAVKALHRINTQRALQLIKSMANDTNEVVKSEVNQILQQR